MKSRKSIRSKRKFGKKNNYKAEKRERNYEIEIS